MCSHISRHPAESFETFQVTPTTILRHPLARRLCSRTRHNKCKRRMMQAEDNCAAVACPSLPMDLICRILESLPPNYLVLICRLVCKELWRRFSQPHHLVARFGLPLPAIAVCGAWLPHLQQSRKQLTFRGKLQMLSAAASSGSEVNLELAWELLSPCIAHGLDSEERSGATDAGTAAVKSGHLYLLPWLLQHGCPLNIHATLAAAAEHCDLAGLQRVWELLGCDPDPPSRHDAWLYDRLAGAAAISGRDTVAKLAWVMAMAEGSRYYKGPRLLLNAVTGAAFAGRLPVLHWLLEVALQRGVPLGELWSCAEDGEERGQALARALGAGHLAVADWLVDEAGYPLPQQEQAQDQDQEEEREHLWGVAAMGGNVDALRWLLLRGVPVDSCALPTAVGFGHLGAVRFLHEECGLGLEHVALWDAAGSRSIPTAQWLLQAGCRMGPRAYEAAARAGDVAMIRWLVLDAKCPWSQGTIAGVIKCWTHEPGNSIDELKAAVRLLVEAGCPCDRMAGAADGAAITGRLPLLRYLHEELGAGFGPGTLTAAAMGGCEAVLEWLMGAGCRAGEEGPRGDPYVAAAVNGDVATLRCLRRLGVPWGAGVLRGAVDGYSTPPSAVRWLVEQGVPLDREALEKAKDKARWRGERWSECAAWLAARLEAAEHGA